MSAEGKWGYSRCGETYYGMFDTKEEAIEEGRVDGDPPPFAGQYRAPIMPWKLSFASELIEHVLVQEDYSGDWAEGCLDATPDQEKELDTEIGKVVKAWCEKHGLTPEFGLVVDHE